MKTCSCCGEAKPLSDFYARRGDCKVCARRKQTSYNRTHAAEINAKAKLYYSENREEIRVAISARRAARRIVRPVQPIPSEKACGRCAVVKPLTAFHKHKMGKHGIDSMCRECKLAAKAAWQKANPERNAMNSMRYHVRKKNVAVNDFTLAQWAMLKERYNFSCAYCGERVPVLTQDHVLALSRGGNHTAANIVPACRRCNASKNDRPVEEFLKVSVGRRSLTE